MTTDHGYNAYTKGCRCDVCREAKAAYMSAARRRGRERALAYHIANGKPMVLPLNTHGRHGYEVHGCRCQSCTTAHSRSHKKVAR